MLQVDAIECQQVIADESNDFFTGIGLFIPCVMRLDEVDLDGSYPSGVLDGATVATRLIETTEALATIIPGRQPLVDEILCLDWVVCLDRPLETGSELPVDLIDLDEVRLLTIIVE